MATVQKVYTKECKEQAVQPVPTSGKPMAQGARELGISDTNLKDRGRRIARTRVARLMRRAQTTQRGATHPVAPHIFHRKWTATEPKTKWGTALTSLSTRLSLAALLDVSSRAVVGWSRSASGDEALAERTLKIAVPRCRRHLRDACLRAIEGRSHTSRADRHHLEHMEAVGRMLRKGHGWETAARKSFFRLLKEACAGGQFSPSQEKARQALFESQEISYNRRRRHWAPGYVSSLASEQDGE